MYVMYVCDVDVDDVDNVVVADVDDVCDVDEIDTNDVEDVCGADVHYADDVNDIVLYAISMKLM